MKRPLSSLLDEISGYRLQGRVSVPVTGITADSRRVEPGMIFVAVPGYQQDGILYAEEAIFRGARVIVSSPGAMEPDPRITLMEVEDARMALSALAAAWHGHPSRSLDVAGITGTNGKTSVSFIVRHLLKWHGIGCGLIGTVRYEIGGRSMPSRRTTPDAAELQGMLREIRRAGGTKVVMETSSHALMQGRVADVRFRVGTFTNLSRDHLDYHQDMDSYYRAKRNLFQYLARGGRDPVAVINTDDAWGRRLREEIDGARILGFGRDPRHRPQFLCQEASVGRHGIRFRLLARGGRHALEIPLVGEYNLENSLAGIATAVSLGVPLDSMAEALACLPPAPGRLEAVDAGQPFSVFIDYAHTPDALERVLGSLRELGFGRIHLLFGCGGNRDEGKRPLMGEVASRMADRVWITSDNSRYEDPERIAEQIAGGMESPPDRVELDRQAAIEGILAEAGDEDVVLIAGKGHETSQEIEGAIFPFEDRFYARRALERLGHGAMAACKAG